MVQYSYDGRHRNHNRGATMTTFHFQTHVSDSGVITLPPEFYDRRVVVSLNTTQDKSNEKNPVKKKRKASAEEVQQFMETCYGCLEGLSDEEFERLKMDRIMGE